MHVCIAICNTLIFMVFICSESNVFKAHQGKSVTHKKSSIFWPKPLRSLHGFSLMALTYPSLIDGLLYSFEYLSAKGVLTFISGKRDITMYHGQFRGIATWFRVWVGCFQIINAYCPDNKQHNTVWWYHHIKGRHKKNTFS